MIATFALLLFTPFGTASFGLVAIAFVGLTLAHTVYWAVTQR